MLYLNPTADARAGERPSATFRNLTA